MITVFRLAALAVAVAALWHAVPQAGDRFSAEPVEIKIGAGYLIPRNYIVNIAPDAEDPELVTMRAVWPGLEPLSQENAHLWERRIPERQIHVAILERPRDGYRQLHGLIRNLRVLLDLELKPEPSDFGLMRYAYGLERRLVPEDTSYRAPDSSPVVFKCNDATDSVKRNFAFEPICIVEYKLRDGSGLYYRFFMVNLAHWRAIDQATRGLVDGFRRAERRRTDVRPRDSYLRPPDTAPASNASASRSELRARAMHPTSGSRRALGRKEPQ